MKNLDELSVIELNKSELINTQGGWWKAVQVIASVGYWVWNNWDELSEGARAEVSDTIR